jgi:hypothetical protein
MNVDVLSLWYPMPGWYGLVDRFSVGGGRVDGDQVLRLLGEREAAARVEWLRLEQEAGRIAGLIEECRRETERLAIAREVLSGLVNLPVEPARAAPAAPVLEGMKGSRIGYWRCSPRRAGRCGAGRVVAVLGEDPSVARHGERVRHRLTKLVAAGRVSEVEPGLFTLAGDSGRSAG